MRLPCNEPVTHSWEKEKHGAFDLNVLDLSSLPV